MNPTPIPTTNANWRTGVREKLKFSEYKKERKKDGGYSDMEETYFKKVIKYCGSEEAAKTFSPCWNKA